MLTRNAGWIAGLISAATALVYIVLIVRQEEGGIASDEVGLVALVVGMIIGAGVAAAVGGSSTDLKSKRILLGAASGGFLSLGMLSLFSIGVLLLLAGIASTFAWVRAMIVSQPGPMLRRPLPRRGRCPVRSPPVAGELVWFILVERVPRPSVRPRRQAPRSRR